MKNSIYAFAIALALASTPMLAGCANVDDAPETAPDALSATIGPEGATLTGAPGTAFEGLTLVVPPGALRAPTAVRVTTAFDATPLPRLAVRVGEQFAIEPAGLALAVPATLTLPVRAESVARLSQQPSDVRVWSRGAADWELLTASAFTEATVTVSVSSFGLTAAGVVKGTQAPACGVVCRLPQVIPSLAPCASPSGFCVDSLGVASLAVDDDAFAVNAGATAIFYTTQTGVHSLQGVRRVLHGGATQRMSAITVPEGSLGSREGLVVDPVDESLWAGLRYAGNVRLPLSGAAQYFDAGQRGFGAVLSLDGALHRISNAGRATRNVGQSLFGSVVAWEGVAADGPAVADPTARDGLWAVSGGSHQVAGSSISPTGEITIAPPHTVADGGNRGRQVSRFSPTTLRSTLTMPAGVETFHYLGALPDGSVVVALWNGHDWTLARASSTQSPQAIAAVPAFIDFQVDRAGGMWVAALRSPELLYVSPDGGLSTALLTTAAPGTSAYAAAIPSSLRVLPDGSVVVLTTGHEFLQLRRTGG